MKNKNNIRDLLGFSQVELAQLLQVSRSQLSLYELGKRSLPLHATEKLAILLKQVQNINPINNEAKNKSVDEHHFLQQLILKNEHQQLLVERKIKAFEKKQKALESSKKVLSELMSKEHKKNKKEVVLLKTMSVSKEKKTSKNDSFISLQLQLKKEVLAFEKKLLLKKLSE